MKNLLHPLRNLLESNFVNADQNFNHLLNPLLELQKIYGSCYHVKHLCKFEKKKNKLYLMSHQAYYFSQQEVLNTSQFIPLREDNYLKKLPANIDQKKLTSSKYLKIDHIIFLLAETKHNWEELNPKEASFYWLEKYLFNYTIYFQNEVSNIAISSLNQLQIIIPRFQSEINALIIRCENISRYELDFRYHEIMLETLDNLLFYLEKYYFRYLVLNSKSSRAYKQNLLIRKRGKIDYIIRRLYSFEFIRIPLQELICDDVKLDYQRLDYLLKLSNSLFSEIYPIKNEITVHQIINILQAYNFNSLFFVKYWHDLLLEKCLTSKNFRSCEKFLQQELNQAKKLGLVKDAWIPDQPSLRDTMIELGWPDKGHKLTA